MDNLRCPTCSGKIVNAIICEYRCLGWRRRINQAAEALHCPGDLLWDKMADELIRRITGGIDDL